MHTEDQVQVSFCPFAPQEVSGVPKLTLGDLLYTLKVYHPSETPLLILSWEYTAICSPTLYHGSPHSGPCHSDSFQSVSLFAHPALTSL